MPPEIARAFYQTLSQTEWLAPADLVAYRNSLLAALVTHARQHVPYYPDILGDDPAELLIKPERWAALPVLTKSGAVAHAAALRATWHPPQAGAILDAATSGSTGTPFRLVKSELSAVASQCLTQRLFRWWRFDGAKSLAVITHAPRATGDGDMHHGWHMDHPNSRNPVLSAATPLADQANWLKRRRPAYLASFPAILRELAQTMAGDLGRPRFKCLLSFGGVVDARTRALCRAGFGCEIADNYGSEEVDHLAAQCADCGDYHISAETAFVEVLDQAGRPCRPGETGRVVVTSLYNYAMPLIRYDIGDYAEVGPERPSCGRGLPTLRRILGRSRNLFRFRDGVALWPDIPRFRLDEFISLRQFQMIQLDVDRIEIKYVPSDEARAIDLPALRAVFREVLRQPVELALTPVAQIDRLPNGKSEDCISLVSED